MKNPKKVSAEVNKVFKKKELEKVKRGFDIKT